MKPYKNLLTLKFLHYRLFYIQSYATIIIGATMSKCFLCPRKCGVDRDKQKGFCGSDNNLIINKYMLHKWEEPIISGTNGSGAIFFSNCSLKCIYCQNYEISSLGNGKNTSVNQLVEIIKQLEKSGAHNINFVSPTHYTDHIIQALDIYKPNIPIVWNTSGYETIETIKKLKNYVDIYLADFKYFDSELSQKYSQCRDYFDFTSKAIKQMKINQPKDIIENGLMKKGVIIRHLILPNHIEDSKKIFDYIKSNYGNDCYISVMGQYVPYYKALQDKDICRKLKPLEYKIVESYVKKLGFTNGFLQDLDSANICYTPKFNITIDK